MNIYSKIQTPVFNILVCEVNENEIFNLSKAKPIKRILSTRNPLAINPIVIIADPFVFVHKEMLYLFFEEQEGLKGKGVLKMVSTKDLKSWTSPKLVLEEPFHLSYPNIFEHKGSIYMMPETGHNKDIRLYKATDDTLRHWDFQHVMLKGRNYVDSSIFTNGYGYYLMTSEFKGSKQYALQLFYADDPINGKWVECGCSPLSQDSSNARCGGPIIEYKGHQYRMAQRCDGGYGGGLIAYDITTVSITSYAEQKKEVILPCCEHVLQYGGHHYSVVNFRGKKVAAVDYLSMTYNIWEIGKRILSKLKSGVGMK